MDFERAFVQGGGLLIAGLDPTGNGGIVAGFGDLREVELLVEACFTPLEAIKIASFNGAKFLGENAHIGSIAVGKQADLMIVRGNPALNISEIEKVETVFKDGVGYDSEKLNQSVQGSWESGELSTKRQPPGQLVECSIRIASARPNES
jgi:adenine deaminase